jgi:hypothetical protein
MKLRKPFGVFFASSGKGVVNWVDLEVRLALSRPTGAADYPRLRRDLANVEVARRGAMCISKVDNTA